MSTWRPRPMSKRSEAPAKVAPAKRASVDRGAVWDRMDAHGLSRNEVARRAGVSTAHLSQIMSGKANPSPPQDASRQPARPEALMP